jgi:hypothetical protein
MSDADAASTAVDNAATQAVVSVEEPKQAAPPSAADPGATPAGVDDAEKKIISDGDIQKEPEEEYPLLKSLVEQRAAIKRLKDQLDGDLVWFDRHIDEYRAACKKARLLKSPSKTDTVSPTDG